MNKMDIDDILTAVNNMNENDDNVLASLHHRTPYLEDNHVPIKSILVKNKNDVSITNPDIQTFIRSEESSLPKEYKNIKNQEVSVPVAKCKKTVSINTNISQRDINNVDDKNNLSYEIDSSIKNSHMTSLMGYSIPSSTLYFIIVLIIIATGLYFLTSDKKKDKEKKKESA